MKMQRVNPANTGPMQMNNYSAMMGMMNAIQKIGKGKRKYEVDLEKNDKRFLGKFVDEVKKQFPDEPVKGNNLYSFFSYVKEFCESKGDGKLKLSYEEYEFIKKMMVDSLRGMKDLSFPWYQFIKKLSVKLMKKQYTEILKKFK